MNTKNKYQANLGGVTVTRSSYNTYNMAAVYRHKSTGEFFGKPAFSAGRPNPNTPATVPTEKTFFRCYPRTAKYRQIFLDRIKKAEEKMAEYELITSAVEKL